jgi:hypothetical protein
MSKNRFALVGTNLSLVGVVLVLFVQMSSDSWRVNASCDGGSTVSGSISAPAGSHVIHVVVTYHVPGSSDWLPVPGASQTLNVTGSGPHAFGPLDVSATPVEANSIRVEIEVEGDPTNEKSESFKPCGGATPVPTQSPTQPPPTATQPPPTATQPVSTATAPVGTATQPPSTATQPPGTATQPPSTATQPPGTATQPPSTSTQPPGTATQPAFAATATRTPISEQGGRQVTPTPTLIPSIRGIPSAGDGGLLAQHRTSFTVLGVALIIAGFALIASRGFVDARRV